MGLPCASWSKPRHMNTCTSMRVHTARINSKLTRRCFIRRSSHGIWTLVTVVSMYNVRKHTPTLYIAQLSQVLHAVPTASSLVFQDPGAARLSARWHRACGESYTGLAWCFGWVGFWACWVLDELGFGRIGLGELGFWQVNLFVFCPMYFVLCQSVQQFTGSGCVGRVKNLEAWGVGLLMQLGFERGKKLCMWEFVCMCDCVYSGNMTICCSCDGVMWKTMVYSCRINTPEEQRDECQSNTVRILRQNGKATAVAWQKEHQCQVMCLPPLLHQSLRGSHWLSCTQQALDIREAKTVTAGRRRVKQPPGRGRRSTSAR